MCYNCADRQSCQRDPEPLVKPLWALLAGRGRSSMYCRLHTPLSTHTLRNLSGHTQCYYTNTLEGTHWLLVKDDHFVLLNLK